MANPGIRAASTDTLSLIEQAYAPIRGRRLLDVGCGAGALCAALARRGAEMTGLDPSGEALAEARRRCPESRFVQGRADVPSFPPAAFDGAIFLNSLHHIEPMAAALAQASRVVVPGGAIVVIEPATHGSFFAALLPVEDETEVRLAAQDAIATAVDEGILMGREVLDYERVDVFADLDAFLDRIVAADRRRQAQIDHRRREIETIFMRVATRDASSRFVLVQPLRAHILISPGAAKDGERLKERAV